MSSSLIDKVGPKPLPSAISDLEEIRAFSRVQLIAFDLDGTLIGQPAAPLGPRLLKLMSSMARSNVMVTLATGRTLTGVASALGDLRGLGTVPLVLYNGSVVMQADQEALIYHQAIPDETVDAIFRYTLNDPAISSFFYSVDPGARVLDVFAEPESVFYAGAMHPPTVDFNGMRVRSANSDTLASVKIVAILIQIEDTERRQAAKHMLANLEGISVTASGSKYIELRPAGSSKAVGLQHYCDRAGISAARVLAMGDNDNDAELLAWAGISVCVKNASAGACAVSQFQSAHGAGNAAIEVLEIVRRAQRLFKDRKKNDNATSQ